MKLLDDHWLSLRTKIILPYMLLALLLAIAAAYVCMRVVFDSIEERFVNQLIEAGKLATEWNVGEENRLLGTERLLAFATGIPEAIRAEDAEKLRELTYPIVVNNREEWVDIVDRRGISIVSLRWRIGSTVEDYEFSRGDDASKQIPFVTQVLQAQSDAVGDKYAGIVSDKRGEYFCVAGPIHDANGNLVGAAIVGKSLNTLARQIREATLAQTTLYDRNGKPLTTTLLKSQPLDGETATAVLSKKSSASFARDLTASNIEYREILGPWEIRDRAPLGLIGVAFAKNFLVRVSQNTWLQLLLSVLIAFLLVLILGFWIASRISAPLVRLKQATVRVAEGDLGVQVESRGGDEVATLAQCFNQMVANLYRSQNDLVAAYDTTLEGWSKALELRDREVMGHSQRVVDLTLRLAREMNITGAQVENLRRGALLHDIGKMAIPDEILFKPGPLTADEWKAMRQHPIYAIQLLQDIPYLAPALDIPANHHEWWDGSGYPRGLKGEEIPVAARIFAVADAWDSMLSDRYYRKAISTAAARQEIQQGSGTQFDPQIVNIFLRLVPAPSQQQDPQ
ncbi:MAG: HD domain-containing protein [Anaerolineales bacterium]|nr:HD domain-containing protein [Anaerolineales bacterium]